MESIWQWRNILALVSGGGNVDAAMVASIAITALVLLSLENFVKCLQFEMISVER